MEINAVSKGMTTSMKKSIGTRDDDGGGGNKSKHMHACDVLVATPPLSKT